MQIAVVTGVLACTLIFALGSEQTSALPLEKLNTTNEITSTDILLAVVAPKKIEEVKEEDAAEEPTEKKHVVEENESLSDIGKIYDVTWKKIYDKNTKVTDPDIINPGAELLIPAAEEEIPARELPVAAPVVTAPAVRTASTSTQKTAAAPPPAPVARRGSTGGNRYTAGNCTWHAKSMRPDLPNNLGNAQTWVYRAASQGIPTGSAPRVGAIAQKNNHVAYVTGVNGDGTINISDMNYRSLYAVTYRTVPANQWSYIY